HRNTVRPRRLHQQSGSHPHWRGPIPAASATRVTIPTNTYRPTMLTTMRFTFSSLRSSRQPTSPAVAQLGEEVPRLVLGMRPAQDHFIGTPPSLLDDLDLTPQERERERHAVLVGG